MSLNYSSSGVVTIWDETDYFRAQVSVGAVTHRNSFRVFRRLKVSQAFLRFLPEKILFDWTDET
jgi:hypothetical protein